MQKYADFYMGANSPEGFKTYYDEFKDPKPGSGWRSFLIKGGAGTGKSSLMKRISAECADSGIVERIHCSSDPNSLDGVILNDKKISVCDATPPHVIEPAYPGGYETVINLCEYFDEPKMEARIKDTVRFQTQNNQCHKKCCSYLGCASILQEHNKSIVCENTNFSKISALAGRIISREIKPISNSFGSEHKRLLSAVTNIGVYTYVNTITSLAEKIYLIKDEYGVASCCLLDQIRAALIKYGYEFYSCYCPMNQQNRIEHIIVPSLSLAFATANKFHSFDNIKPINVISYKRFTNMAAVQEKKQIMNFHKKAALELINEAVSVLKQAKVIHDDLETQYTDAVNFEGVNQKSNEVLDKINSRG